jgi:hypothetical protein
MKLIVQALVLGVFAVGASAAIGSSFKTTVVTPHSAAFPVPTCNPGHPCGSGSGK